MKIRQLFDLRINSKEACQAFLSLRRRRPMVRLPHAVHSAAFLPTGQGKGTSLIVPFLRTCPESVFCLDIKNGENAKLTAKDRRRFGPVHILDPYNVVTDKSACLNPLDFINKESRLAIDDCNERANAIVVRAGTENEPHWNDRAEAVTAAVMAVVVAHGKKENGTRSLQAVREIISNPQMLKMAIEVMAESKDLWGGLLTQMGGDLYHLEDKEKASVLSTVGRHLRFLGTPSIADCTKSSSFHPNLRHGVSTTYLVLPSERNEASQGLIRLWISTIMAACVRGGLDQKGRVHFVLDETAALGPLPAINNALSMGRGYGIHLQTYWQSQGQIMKCFPKEGEDLLLLSNSAQLYAAVNEPSTAEFVSKRLGTQTIVVNSGGRSGGRSHNVSQGPHQNVSYGWTNNTNNNWNQQQRALLTIDEVCNLDPRVCITFMPSMRPIMTRLVRWYEEPKLFTIPGWFIRQWRAFKTFLIAAILCAAMIGMAAALVRVLDSQSRRPMPAYYGE